MMKSIEAILQAAEPTMIEFEQTIDEVFLKHSTDSEIDIANEASAFQHSSSLLDVRFECMFKLNYIFLLFRSPKIVASHRRT